MYSSICINVEIIGDCEFIGSVQEQAGVWVLMVRPSLYALPAEGGRDLPVWSSAEKAELFAENLNQRGLSPVFVPMGNFLGAAWLGSSSLQRSSQQFSGHTHSAHPGQSVLP